MNTSSVPASTAKRSRPYYDVHSAVSHQPLRAGGPRRIAFRVSRLLDVAIATLLLAVLAVPMLLVAALIKLTSRGPALYRQERSGLGGRLFVILKFRTMRDDAEAETGPIWSKRGDPRCTRPGNLLRRYSIDELPQLINVLRGEMSLVGPRPERPFFVDKFARQLPDYRRRLDVLPGITGWAQINGWRGDSSLEKRLEFDLYYIRNWSVAFNLGILLLTPLRVLVENNARPDPQARGAFWR
jgi:exopolysaccharide biosynthesis polyprenyl glycosylphosphotransferase